MNVEQNLEEINSNINKSLESAENDTRPNVIAVTKYVTIERAKEAYDAGHTIGLHTYTHNYDEVYESDEAYFADLEKVGEVAKEQIGFVPCFIRFPGGSSNMVSAKYNKGIMSRLVNTVQEKGYQYYDWNLDSGDAAGCGKEEI